MSNPSAFDHLVQSTATYLINSAWQVPLLAFCTAALARLAISAGNRLQYRLWAACLLLAIGLPALSIIGPLPMGHWRAAKATQVGKPATEPGQPSPRRQMAIYADEIVQPASNNGAGSILAWLYLASVLIGALRLARRLWITRGIVRSATPISLPSPLAESMVRSADVLGTPSPAIYGSSRIPCPAAVSWLRPILLVPASFASTPQDQAEAAIAHELAHIRRHDFETNLLFEHLAILVFYHPVAHWIKRRLADAREVVCDEMAADATTGRTAYAKSLLNLAVSIVTQTAAQDLSLGILETGPLELRILRLMNTRMPQARRYAVVCMLCCWIAFATVCAGAAALAVRPAEEITQTPPLYGQILRATGPKPSFEVATIRRLPNGPPPTPGATPPNIVRFFFTPKMLVMFAYNLPDFAEARIKGPGWMEDQYVVEGKIDDSQYAAMQNMTAAEKQEQIQLMMQSLLAERFKLRVHFDTVMMPMYELVLARGGSKLTPANSALPKRFGIVHKGAALELTATGTTADGLAALLGRQPEVGGRTVLNRTGLAGEYDLTLRWTPPAQGIESATAPQSDAPSYFTAIQEQLGLRLAPTKGPVDYLVIDHIERPSEN